jgi:hypothetical protein
MASAKVVAFFKDGAGYGWSETFYYGPGPTATNLTIDVPALIRARAAILTSSSTITHARISTLTKRLPIIVQLGGGTGVPGSETPPTAPSEVALLVTLQAVGSGYLRPFLRGIPLRIVGADLYVPDPTFTANLNSFFNVLKNGLWNVVGTLGGPPLQQPIAHSPAPNTPRGYTFTNGATSTFVGTVGQLIRVHGCRVPGYNGIKRITQVNSPTVYTVGGASPAVADNGVAPYLTTLGSVDAAINSTVVDGLTRRGAGRPFGLSRGRKATLYSLRQ